MRPRRPIQGFTLVELLVVIAIIGILAGLIAAGLPIALERARIARLLNDFNQIRTILTAYNVDHGTYPPMYGYITDRFKGDNHLTATQISAGLANGDFTQNDVFFLVPWMELIGHQANRDLYDSFAKLGYDTDQDGVISRLEFAPVGQFVPGPQKYEFRFTQLYLGANGNNNSDTVVRDDALAQLNSTDPRPYIYIAVNARQARIFASIMYDEAGIDGNRSNPRVFNLTQGTIQTILDRLSFPPSTYDTYVLISVGPNAAVGTAGLLPEFGVNGFMDVTEIPEVYQYHILGLAAYFMATRDAEGNGEGDGELDFDFLARTRRGQAKNPDNQLPSMPNAVGPVIYLPKT